MPSVGEAIEMLKDTFDKYAGRDGDPKTLTKKELTELLHDEIPHDECKCQEEVGKFFSQLDFDEDGVISFQEFVVHVTALVMIIYQY